MDKRIEGLKANMDIIASDISKSFGDNRVLSDFSRVFREGSITAVTGASGCGKSTLLSVLMGILAPDSGSVIRPERISAVFQENRLCENLTISANIRLVTGKRYSLSEISGELDRKSVV